MTTNAKIVQYSQITSEGLRALQRSCAPGEPPWTINRARRRGNARIQRRMRRSAARLR